MYCGILCILLGELITYHKMKKLPSNKIQDNKIKI